MASSCVVPAILFALAISFWDLFKSLRADVIFGRDKYLDHIVAFGETHLRWILSTYAAYYNQARTHLALQKDSPVNRAVQRFGRIIAISVLGGLHHQYLRI